MGRSYANAKLVIMEDFEKTYNYDYDYNYDSDESDEESNCKIYEVLDYVSVCICSFDHWKCGEKDPQPSKINSEYFNIDKIKEKYGQNAIVALIINRG